MSKFWNKIKKSFRKWSKGFNCVCSEVRKNKHDYNSSSDSLASQRLEILLLRTLQNQLEEREYRTQHRTTLDTIHKVLEQVGKHDDCPVEAGFSKFTISVSKNSVIHCTTDTNSQSLVVLNRDEDETNRRQSSVVLHQCPSRIFDLSTTFLAPGRFSSIIFKFSDDKGVQYERDVARSLLKSSLLSHSKLVQTDILTISNFNLAMFKMGLVKHIRNMKRDVVVLKQLLDGAGYSGTRQRVTNMNARLRDDFEGKFYEAKTRAANFVKFYKLRKVRGKKSAGRGLKVEKWK